MIKQCLILLRSPKTNGIGSKTPITNALFVSRRNAQTCKRQSFFSTNKSSNPKGRQTKESPTSSTRVSNEGRLSKYLEPTNPFFNTPIFPSFDPNLTLSVLAAHSAFVLVGLGYLTSDILILRLWACGGISLSMLAQYYRPKPLKIPLAWNSLFLGINIVWATLLYQERQEAKYLGEELETVYRSGEFEKRRVSRVDFKRLFVDLARREVKQRGEALKEEGEVTQQLCYILDGSGVISRNGSYLGSLEPNDFTGEIDFIQYVTLTESDTSKEESIRDPLNVDNILSEQSHGHSSDLNSISSTPNILAKPSAESIHISSETAVIYVWDYESLKSYLDQPSHNSTHNALLAYLCHELREKLEDSWRERMRSEEKAAEVQQLAVDFLMDGLKPNK